MEHPSPIRFEGQHHPYGNCESASQVGKHGVHGNQQVDLKEPLRRDEHFGGAAGNVFDFTGKGKSIELSACPIALKGVEIETGHRENRR
jgi:hypothetical protein